MLGALSGVNVPPRKELPISPLSLPAIKWGHFLVDFIKEYQMTISKRNILIIGQIAQLLTTAIDWVIGSQISLTTLHFVNIMFVTWFTTWRWGCCFAVLSIFSSESAHFFLNLLHVKYFYFFLDIASDLVAALDLHARSARSRLLLADGSQRDTLTRVKTLLKKLTGFSKGMRWTTRQPR